MSRAWVLIVPTICACGAGAPRAAADPTPAFSEAKAEAPPPDRSSSLEADERACSLGLARGCNAWGVALLDGKGVAKDVDRAAVVLKKACDLGSDWGCFNWAFLQESGSGIAKNVASASKHYESSCGAGIAHACNRLGLLLSEPEFAGELRPEPARAVDLFEKACTLGLPIACANAGGLLPAVRPEDSARVAELLKLGCDGDIASSCAQYAERVASGDGEPADPKRAVTLFEKACAMDPAVGCYFWGFALVNEQSGLTFDFSRGRELISRACKAGNPEACATLETLDEE